MLGSYCGDDIHRLGRRNLVASDSSPKAVARAFPPLSRIQFSTHRLLQKGFISTGDISKIIVGKW